jgi:hypothetical protein
MASRAGDSAGPSGRSTRGARLRAARSSRGAAAASGGGATDA